MGWLDELTTDETFKLGMMMGEYMNIMRARKPGKKQNHLLHYDTLARHLTTWADDLGSIRRMDHEDSDKPVSYDIGVIQVSAEVWLGLRGNWKANPFDSRAEDVLDVIFTCRKRWKVHTLVHARRYFD